MENTLHCDIVVLLEMKRRKKFTEYIVARFQTLLKCNHKMLLSWVRENEKFCEQSGNFQDVMKMLSEASLTAFRDLKSLSTVSLVEHSFENINMLYWRPAVVSKFYQTNDLVAEWRGRSWNLNDKRLSDYAERAAAWRDWQKKKYAVNKTGKNNCFTLTVSLQLPMQMVTASLSFAW